MNAVHNVSLVN